MKYYKFFTFFIVLTILFFSFNGNIGIKTYPFEHSDKLKHILAFLVLSYFFYKSLDMKYKLLALVFFAGFIEVSQIFTDRESSFFDFLASITGILIYLLIIKIRKLIIQS